MAYIFRRRRFTIFIIICCLSLLIVSWYASKRKVRTLNNKIITDGYESPLLNNHVQDLNAKALHISEQKLEHALTDQNQIITELAEITKLNFFQQYTEILISEQNLEHALTKQNQIRTELEETMKLNGLQQYTEYNTENMPAMYGDEYEVVELNELENAEFLSLMEKLTEWDKEVLFPNGTDESRRRMLMSNHRNNLALSRNNPKLENNLKDRETPTPYDVSYSIEKLEDCNECRGYLDETTIMETEMIAPTKNPSLIIDTPGCKIPKLDPWDPSVSHIIQILDPLVCPGPPLFMSANPGGSISLNETVLKEYYNMTADELTCFYQPIQREHEKPPSVREVSFTLGNARKLNFEVPLNEDYIGAICNIKNKTDAFEQFFPLVRLKNEIEEERNARSPPTPRLNVILAGIDSVSKFNFLRHFRKTLSFLNEKMSPFEMNGYTKVGDNTFPNLIPMLTGHFVEYYWNETLKNIKYFDDIDLIWKEYAKKGYRTFYAEDHPIAGTFNYLKRGFYDPPTDYYFRPLALLIETSTLKEHSREFCLNSQLETDVIYNYLRDFIKAMEHRPYFAFAMVSRITHDILNYASWADTPTVNLLEDLSNMGALNNSLLVLFSDHGIRFGALRYTYVGRYEERMPFMYIHAPKWFLDQYPEFAKNLKTNQDRLMTLFDIHATMVHLLDLNRPHKERSAVTLGTSLLDEIPANRTCDEANIQRHWCPCETFDILPVNASEAVNASQALVKDINSQLAAYGDICEVLEVDHIMSAMVGKANDLVLRYVKADHEKLSKKLILGKKIEPIADYMITLVTRPGGAVFEGTIRHDPESGSYTVLGISRLSLYGLTSWCIDSQRLKLFCYCKVQNIPL